MIMRWLMITLAAVAAWASAASSLIAASPSSANLASVPSLRLAAGDLEIGLRRTSNGVKLESLSDLKLKQELLATNAPALFNVTLRHTVSKKELRLSADTGWEQTTLRKTRGGCEMRWAKPADETLSGVTISASATADSSRSAWRWKLRVENTSTNWSV